MNLRRLTDPIGKWVMGVIQSEETKRRVKENLPNESPDSERPSGLTEVEEEYLELFEEKTKRYSLIVLTGLVILSGFDIGLCGAIPNQVFGLSVDIFGALVLGRGVLKGPYTITGSTGMGTSRQKQNNLTESSVDGVFGVFFLVLGLLLQIVALSGLTIRLPSCPII